jgi:hypothetical protein
MPPKMWAPIKDLLRSYARLRIDMMLLSGMLLRAQLDQIPPQDWHEDLLRLRKLPAHQQALEELESLLREVEKDMRESEITRLLGSLPPSDWVN